MNLVGASRLILYDIDWNPANDIQVSFATSGFRVLSWCVCVWRGVGVQFGCWARDLKLVFSIPDWVAYCILKQNFHFVPVHLAGKNV